MKNQKKRKTSNKKVSVADIGEYELVERIKKQIRSPKLSKQLLIGPGDDAFVAKIPAGLFLVVTKDLLVEGVHFKQEWTTPYKLGYKAMASNISDLAAMGGCKPLYAVVGIALTGKEKLDFVSEFSRGMKAVCSKYGVAIAGGDTVSSKTGLVISITAIGAVKKEEIITRSGARPRDLICSSGNFGDSGAGLYLLQKGSKFKQGFEKQLLNKHLMPEPRVKQASLLAKNRLAASMIDSSDGLQASVGFLTKESGAGARIHLDKVPVSTALKEFRKEYQKADYWNIVLNGAEEYELVFTVKPQNIDRARRLLPGLKCFGEIVKGDGIEYFINGQKASVKQHMYEHFE